MRRAFTLAAIVVALGGVHSAVVPSASAQQQPLPATTVQLPSFSYFSVNTSVSVPDRGGAYLGSVNRGRDGRTSRGFGPLANRGTGSDRAASGMSVHATIIDLAELDEAVLADAAAKRGALDPAVAKAELLSRHVGRGTGSIAAIRAQQATAAQARADEAAQLLAQGQQAQAQGKPAIARIYYQMVARMGEGDLKHQAQSRLSALADAKATAVAKR